VQDALSRRLGHIERAARLAAGELSGEELDALDGFCVALLPSENA